MKKAFTLIVILSLAILAFYWFIEPDKLGREDLLTAEVLKTLRGKIYSAPDIESSPFKYFFIDEDGDLYGIEPEIKEGAPNDKTPNIEVIGKIEEFKNSNKEIEIKGKIEEKVEDYGEKRITIKEIKKMQESTSCQNQGGSVELKRICTFPDGKEYEIK